MLSVICHEKCRFLASQKVSLMRVLSNMQMRLHYWVHLRGGDRKLSIVWIYDSPISEWKSNTKNTHKKRGALRYFSVRFLSCGDTWLGILEISKNQNFFFQKMEGFFILRSRLAKKRGLYRIVFAKILIFLFSFPVSPYISIVSNMSGFTTAPLFWTIILFGGMSKWESWQKLTSWK